MELHDQKMKTEVDKLLQQVMGLPRGFEISKEDEVHIRNALDVAWKSPHCPQSGFQVGTVILVNGITYKGVNWEDYSSRICCCGERSAVWGARPIEGITGEKMEITKSYVFAVNPHTKLVETWISSSCGLCRQIYVTCGNPVIYFTFHDQLMRMTATELLPDSYALSPQPQFYGEISPLNDPETYLTDILNLPREDIKEITPQVRELFLIAIKATRYAYIPYYPIREGAALRIDSDLFKTGYKIFDRANYQNASYGASDTSICQVFTTAKYKLNKLIVENNNREVKPVYTLNMLAFFAFDNAGKIVQNMPPSGLDRQVAAEEVGGLNTQIYYIYDGKLKSKTLKELLPYPFTFTAIQSH